MSKLNKNIAEIWQDDYVVPLYQRNYARQRKSNTTIATGYI